MLFQEENQSNSGAVDLVNLAQTVTASFLMHSWPLKMPRKHLSGTLASQTGRLCFDCLCSLMRPPNTCPLVHCVKYKVLKKPQVLRVHLAPQVCLPAYSPHCPNTKTACSTPAKHYGSSSDGAARESHIHLFLDVSDQRALGGHK